MASGAVAAVDVGAFDVESGVVGNSVQVTANVALGALPAGSNLAAGVTIDPEGSSTA